VCDSAGGLARSRRVACSYLALCCCGGSFFGLSSVGLCFGFFFLLPPFGVIPACSFHSFKEVQGYMMLACGMILLVEELGGLERALSGGDVACIVEVLCRYF
jgi:hypothetical protein